MHSSDTPGAATDVRDGFCLLTEVVDIYFPPQTWTRNRIGQKRPAYRLSVSRIRRNLKKGAGFLRSDCVDAVVCLSYHLKRRVLNSSDRGHSKPFRMRRGRRSAEAACNGGHTCNAKRLERVGSNLRERSIVG